MNGRIGIGVITCNREGFFKVLTESLPRVDYSVVVNDGLPYEHFPYKPYYDEVIQHDRNTGVGIAKNDALIKMLEAECEHIFLLEDDIKIINADVFSHYISCARRSGVRHLNYAYHGFGNRDANYAVASRRLIYDGEDAVLSLNKNILGALSYYHAEVLRKVGLLDPRYKNALEHVDHTYSVIKQGLHPPFWWFADAANSECYISDQVEMHMQSVIRKHKLLWKLSMWRNTRLFKKKWGQTPWEIADVDYAEVEKSLVAIKAKYGSDTRL
jgi:GT2 family glycosyltransferase